jgi:hypothetical protein
MIYKITEVFILGIITFPNLENNNETEKWYIETE